MTDDTKHDGTVGKALSVLDQVAAFGRPVRFSELLDASPFPKATLYRFLQTLVHQGMLDYAPETASYSPGLRLVRLAHAAWSQSSLAPVARPWMEQLSAETQQSIHLAQLDGGQVLYVDKRNAVRPMEMFAQTGKVGPAYCTGVGKAMLAHLPQRTLDSALSQQSFYPHTPNTITTPVALLRELEAIRHVGYALDREEHEPGIICCAAPILNRAGRLLGAISVTTSTSRGSLENLETLAPRLQSVAQEIGAAAEAWRFPDVN